MNINMKRINKLIIAVVLLVVFNGCTSLTTYIGEKRIESGLKTYNSRGVTSFGIKKLASGLAYIPDSIIGVECFNKQTIEITKEKNNILKKKTLSIKDIERLKTYIVLSEEASKINFKVKDLKFNYNDYKNSRIKINKAFENYIVCDNRNSTNLPRNKKIEKISCYKSLNGYINSTKVYSIISSLETQVTKQVYLTTSFIHYNHMNSLVNESLVNFVYRNKNHEIEKYIYLKGYTETIPKNTKKYLVAMDFSECKAYSKGLITEKKVDKEVITEHKELVVRGTYRLLINNGRDFSKSKDFEIRKNYNVITEKYKNRMIYGNEREEIMKILNNKFDRIIIRDLKILL